MSLELAIRAAGESPQGARRPTVVAIVLHAHLPYVRHPEHERFLEENWLFEAIVEKMPAGKSASWPMVVRTAVTNQPSNRASLAWTAR